MVKKISIPITEDDVAGLNVGDMVFISGEIYCGRDAVLPKICEMILSEEIKDKDIDLKGNVIFHTAVSPAGVGPTSSNKLEIESSFATLSKAGVKMHLGKGKISDKTIEELDTHNAVYAVIPPVTALLKSKTLEQRIAAFPELGMEALYKLKIVDYPVIIAAAHNKSIY